jgi:ligand-binding sensor domain-containing protein/signal transduction histidine kinase
LKRPSPKQKHSLLSSPLWHCALIASFFAFISCDWQPPHISNNEPVKKPQPINSIKKDSFPPPNVIYITAINQPKVVKAGKPTIKIDSTNGGVPFFTNYGTEQGTPVSQILCSMTDKEGNIWFGSGGGGASKFDGKSFTNYTTAQGLAANSILSMIQDCDGNIWFGSEVGLSKYNGKSFTNYRMTNGIDGENYIASMFQDKSGNIWIGTMGSLFQYNGKSFINYTKSHGLSNDTILCIFQDKAANIWFGSSGRGVNKYDGKTFANYTTAQGISGNSILSIIQDNKGALWFGTNQGATKYDGKYFTDFTKGLTLINKNFWRILQDSKGNIWFGTNNGVIKYDDKDLQSGNGGFTNYTTAQGLPDDEINDIIEDRSGFIWFSTGQGGLSRFEGNSIRTYSPSQGLSGRNVLSILQDTLGNFWFGSEQMGVTKYDGKRFSNYAKAQGFAGYKIHKILQDKAGNVWFAAINGLIKYDGKCFTNYNKVQGLTGNFFYCLLQDVKGNIWIGTIGKGVYKFDGSGFINYTTAQGLPSDNITTIIQDKNKNIWFGTYGGGASKFDGANFTNYKIAEVSSDNNISSMMQDKAGNIWFSTNGNGVTRYDSKNFMKFNTTLGLPDNTINCIVEDSVRKIIWFGTNKGLAGIKRDSLSNDNIVEVFNKSTGYPIKDINSMCLDKNGILWCGCGDNKVIKFDYSTVNKNMIPLNLKIQNIKINDQLMCWNNLVKNSNGKKIIDSLILLNEMVTTFGKALSPAALDSIRNKQIGIRFDSISKFNAVPLSLVLPYKDNNLTIEFAAIEPDLPKQVKYQYKLEGYNKDWSPSSNNTTAIFGNIPEGSYTFKLKALSPYGIWSETEYKFKVLAPWYRTWWAYFIYALLFIGTIWSFIYYRSQQLRRENRILEEKVEHRTEQLKQSLENLKATQSQLIQSEKMASLGELTAGIAHEIQNPLNFVNNFSEVNTELIDELAQEADKGNIEEVKTIASDIKANEQKINHHGRRADAIVKGMLQHSRSSTGVKEPTDINALTDEYLRLSYHGLRAKDNSFNATTKTDFDESIGNINIIPQDIGRVLLNLYNNAFYAVSEKKKALPDYEPIVSVSTKGSLSFGEGRGEVKIIVSDNGNGIPQKIVDKIFQPFFTTKPTGQGTGLGLSLSYDIIKAHGGEIKVETKEGEGTEFIIQLPVA